MKTDGSPIALHPLGASYMPNPCHSFFGVWPVPQDFLNGVCTNVVHMGSKQLNYYAGVMCGGGRCEQG